ncbi:MAG: flagellar protein FliT [Lachnospiraceae bacterium]|nr:flagellar protein FliT [Lachnospiraceae bacterium]MBD5496989.1 flagellar protein FliT [Lachnospiraceae bacterium]
MDNYLKILEESLRKKLQVLDEIQAYNEKQKQVFQSDSVELDEFDAAVEEKGKLIEQISKLDEGFEVLYSNVAKELEGNKEKYVTQIQTLKQLVQQVTEKGVSIQAQEARNKALIESYFAREREQIRQGRQASKAAYDYYKNMSNTNTVPPQFLDSKQ